MIAIYVNRYEVGSKTYFDLFFEEDGNQPLILGSVPFKEGFTEQDMHDKATEIFEANFIDTTSEIFEGEFIELTLDQIIIN